MSQNVCGLRSTSGNHELCTCTWIRCPGRKVWFASGRENLTSIGLPGSNLSRKFTLTCHDDHSLLVLRKDATFLSKPMLTRCLAQIPDCATVLIDAERADFIDRDIRDTLDAFVGEAAQRQITVERMRWPEPAAQEGRAALPSLGATTG